MGPNSYSRLYFHMTDFQDKRGNSRTIKINENSILDIISKTEEFSNYREIVRHSQYESKLNDCSIVTTVFVPVNEAFSEGFLDNLDRLQANVFIQSNNIDRAITSELLEYSPYSILPTKFNTLNNMKVTNVNGSTYINGCKIIIKDIMAENGIIHVVDKLNIPEYYI